MNVFLGFAIIYYYWSWRDVHNISSGILDERQQRNIDK